LFKDFNLTWFELDSELKKKKLISQNPINPIRF
jgi:hypothetical protein